MRSSSQASDEQQLDQYIKHVQARRRYQADMIAQQLRLTDPPVDPPALSTFKFAMCWPELSSMATAQCTSPSKREVDFETNSTFS
jgi:hypothetical protein